MIITGAFLAEAAASVDNKLHVWGGVLESWTVGPDRQFNCVVVVLTQKETGNDDRAVVIELVPPTGDESMRVTFEATAIPDTAELGFAIFAIGGALPFDGRYVFVINSGGDSPAISLPLLVRSLPDSPPPN